MAKHDALYRNTAQCEATFCAFGTGGDMVIGRYQQRMQSWQRLENEKRFDTNEIGLRI